MFIRVLMAFLLWSLALILSCKGAEFCSKPPIRVKEIVNITKKEENNSIKHIDFLYAFWHNDLVNHGECHCPTCNFLRLSSKQPIKAPEEDKPREITLPYDTTGIYPDAVDIVEGDIHPESGTTLPDLNVAEKKNTDVRILIYVSYNRCQYCDLLRKEVEANFDGTVEIKSVPSGVYTVSGYYIRSFPVLVIVNKNNPKFTIVGYKPWSFIKDYVDKAK